MLTDETKHDGVSMGLSKLAFWVPICYAWVNRKQSSAYNAKTLLSKLKYKV